MACSKSAVPSFGPSFSFSEKKKNNSDYSCPQYQHIYVPLPRDFPLTK